MDSCQDLWVCWRSGLIIWLFFFVLPGADGGGHVSCTCGTRVGGVFFGSRVFFRDVCTTWKAKCPIFKAIVAGFRGKVGQKNRTLGVPGMDFHPNCSWAISGNIHRNATTSKEIGLYEGDHGCLIRALSHKWPYFLWGWWHWESALRFFMKCCRNVVFFQYCSVQDVQVDEDLFKSLRILNLHGSS